MSQKNLEQTTEELCLRVIENVLKKNISQAIDLMKKTKEPEYVKQIKQYKTRVLYAGIITGIAAAVATAGTLYYFLAN